MMVQKVKELSDTSQVCIIGDLIIIHAAGMDRDMIHQLARQCFQLMRLKQIEAETEAVTDYPNDL